MLSCTFVAFSAGLRPVVFPVLGRVLGAVVLFGFLLCNFVLLSYELVSASWTGL